MTCFMSLFYLDLYFISKKKNGKKCCSSTLWSSLEYFVSFVLVSFYVNVDQVIHCIWINISDMFHEFVLLGSIFHFEKKKKTEKKCCSSTLVKLVTSETATFYRYLKKRSKTFQTITWKHLCRGLFSAKKETLAQVF